MVSHTEQDILECEIKWALRNTAVDKASGYNEIPAELFRYLEEDAIKVLPSLCQQMTNWKALRDMGIKYCLTCILRNLYAGQEATVRTLYGTTDWFKIEKGVRQGCLLSPCLFNLYTEHIMRHAGLNELQAGIKIGGKHI